MAFFYPNIKLTIFETNYELNIKICKMQLQS
ncbi:MAG: hypothetical protein ACI9H1_001276 [Polaribacter sp.]|jgi:hypothetical protein